MHTHKALISVLFLVVGSTSFAGEPVRLFPGWTRTVAAPQVTRVAVTDPTIAEAVVGKEAVLVTARKAGATSIKLWRREGTPPEIIEVAVETNGWGLVTVLAMTRELAEGAVATKDDFKEVSVPAPMVTSSLVKPEHVSFVANHPLQVPVNAGDLVHWSQFEVIKKKE